MKLILLTSEYMIVKWQNKFKEEVTIFVYAMYSHRK